MFYNETNEFLMEAPGLKGYIMVVVGLHKVRTYIKGNFQSFVVLATWGEQCEYCENCFKYHLMVITAFVQV